MSAVLWVIEPPPAANEEGGKWQGWKTGTRGNRQAEASSPLPPMGVVVRA